MGELFFSARRMSKLKYYGCGINLNKQVSNLIPSQIICCPVLLNPRFDAQETDDIVSSLAQPVHISLSHILFRLGNCCERSGYKNLSNCSLQNPVKSSEKQLIYMNGDDLYIRRRHFSKKLSFQTSENGNSTRSSDINNAIKDLAVEDHSLLIVNKSGQLFCNGINMPLPHIKVEKVSIGKEHYLAQTSNGEVLSWGSGMKGQLGNGELITLDHPERVQGLDGLHIIDIASGGWHSLALSSCGDSYVWGWNDVGQLGIPSLCLRSSGVKWDCLVSHSASQCNSSSLTENKSKSERCRNSSFNTENDAEFPERSNKNFKCVNVQPSPLLLGFWPLDVKVKKIACGDRHTVFLLDNGTAWTCGWNMYGQLGLGCKASQDEPVFVMDHVEDVFAGGWNTIFAVARISS
ncbi:UNVERIFIED_CONTAM: hypothetical protein RMT77_009466 [Armadillidium vulgare]